LRANNRIRSITDEGAAVNGDTDVDIISLRQANESAAHNTRSVQISLFLSFGRTNLLPAEPLQHTHPVSLQMLFSASDLNIDMVIAWLLE
jgi:hypothetical protein